MQQFPRHWKQVRGHTFCGDLLSSRPFVLDLGANVGQFGLQLIREFNADVVAAEPNPTLVIPPHPHLEVLRVAVGGSARTAAFQVSERSVESSLAAAAEAPDGERTITVQVVSLRDVLASHQGRAIDLLKVDVEGAEAELLLSAEDQLLKSVTQLCIEYHDFCGLVTPAQVAQVDARLEGLGFRGLRFSVRDRADMLYVNRGIVTVPSAWFLEAQAVVAPMLAARRAWRRARGHDPQG